MAWAVAALRLSSVLAVFELWSSNSGYEVYAQLKLRLKFVSLSSFVAHLELIRRILSNDGFFTEFDNYFESWFDSFVVFRKNSYKNWQKISDFFQTLFKWFALKNLIFMWLIIQIVCSEAQLTVQTWASKYRRSEGQFSQKRSSKINNCSLRL